MNISNLSSVESFSEYMDLEAFGVILILTILAFLLVFSIAKGILIPFFKNKSNEKSEREIITENNQKKKFTWKGIKEELFGGWSKWEAVYAWSLILLQVGFYVIYPDSLWGFIAGVSGTICVLLVAKRKISNYFFGFIQTGIMMVLGFNVGLIGETGENIFYFVSQFLGIKEWKKNMVEDEEKETRVVETRKFTIKDWVIWLGVTVAGTISLGFIFDSFNGTQPYIDALTLVMALVGQFLMLYRYREQWMFWGVLNVVSIYQWATLGNMSLVALYIAFLINNIYGVYMWSKETKQTKLELN